MVSESEQVISESKFDSGWVFKIYFHANTSGNGMNPTLFLSSIGSIVGKMDFLALVGIIFHATIYTWQTWWVK